MLYQIQRYEVIAPTNCARHMSKEGQRGGCCGKKGYREGPGGVTRKTFGRTELTLKREHYMHPGL